MATAEQILSLIRNHLNNDDAQFRKVALQISAVEARSGHAIVARTIQEMLNQKNTSLRTMRLVSKNKDVDDLLLQVDTYEDMKSLIVAQGLKEKLERVVKEYLKKETLRKYGLANRRKLLLYGASGTGKTMTANAIAKEFNLPFFVVRTEKVVTKFMGETGQKLGRIFDFIGDIPAVYLFDEFDAIGGQRGKDNEVGEMRRVLNSFLQFIERDHSDSLIIAATNNLELLDQALFRRFDDVIHYQLPTDQEKIQLLKNRLNGSISQKEIDLILPELTSLSHAEINQACLDAIKESVINEVKISPDLVIKTIRERRSAYNLK